PIVARAGRATRQWLGTNAELESGLRQERRKRASADVVRARIADALAHDLGDERSVEPYTVELAEHDREISTPRVPTGLEVRTEFHLRRSVRPAHGDPPTAVGRLRDALFRDVGE